MIEVPTPERYVAFLYNTSGNVMLLGRPDGTPFESEHECDAFLEAYLAQYPTGARGLSLPITPSGADT